MTARISADQNHLAWDPAIEPIASVGSGDLGGTELLLEARDGAWWDAGKIGLGPPPLETPEGWLVMYHGVRVTSDGPIYRAGLALLDLEDPGTVLNRSDDWVFRERGVKQFVVEVFTTRAKAEMLAFPLLFLLSLLFFRSLVAAALPLLIGALAIVSTMALLTAASELTTDGPDHLEVDVRALEFVTPAAGPADPDRPPPYHAAPRRPERNGVGSVVMSMKASLLFTAPAALRTVSRPSVTTT